MARPFATEGDSEDKPTSFEEIGPGCYAFTAAGDPNTGVVIGEESVMVIDAQATPVLAGAVIARIREVTDKPVRHLVLTHYHAARVLGASAFEASEILASDLTRALIAERGEADRQSEMGRFPRLFRGAHSIPGLTWPTMTFATAMSVWLGKREVRLMHIGRGHTMGDIIALVPDCGVVFAGDLVEYRSACYCGDAHLRDWPRTLERLAGLEPRALVPGRGAALRNPKLAQEAITLTRGFLSTLWNSVRDSVEQQRSLKEAYLAAREIMDPKYGDYAIYEHCMPFNVVRAYDEAKGNDLPQIWTAERDRRMWAELEAQ